MQLSLELGAWSLELRAWLELKVTCPMSHVRTSVRVPVLLFIVDSIPGLTVVVDAR